MRPAYCNVSEVEAMNAKSSRPRDIRHRTDDPVTVADLMTSPAFAVEESETIELANAEMKWAHIRHLPVVRQGGRFSGLLSQADIHTALALYGTGATLPVAVVMRHPVFTVEPQASIVEAMELILDNKLSALPVVNRLGVLVGILTESDFVRRVYRELSGRAFAAPAGCQELVTVRPRKQVSDSP
jgi:acetoin utilization protein AcuB